MLLLLETGRSRVIAWVTLGDPRPWVEVVSFIYSFFLVFSWGDRNKISILVFRFENVEIKVRPSDSRDIRRDLDDIRGLRRLRTCIL